MKHEAYPHDPEPPPSITWSSVSLDVDCSAGAVADNALDTAPIRTWSAVALEREIIAALDRQPDPGERIEFAFRRKEAELTTLFARLSIADARELNRRLTLQLDGDPIVSRFARMIAARRTRLMAFLADARRRAAICCTRR